MIRPLLLAVIVAASAAACRPDPRPVDLRATWQSGEVTRYDVRSADGEVVDARSWNVERSSEGWSMSMTSSAGRTLAQVEVDARLRPLRSSKRRHATLFEAEYGAEDITMTTTSSGSEPSRKVVSRPVGALDNEQVTQTLRALPFAEVSTETFVDVSVAAGGMMPFVVTVDGREAVETALGAVEAWKVITDFGALRLEAWYDVEASHRLVRYFDPKTERAHVLRSISLSTMPWGWLGLREGLGAGHWCRWRSRPV